MKAVSKSKNDWLFTILGGFILAAITYLILYVVFGVSRPLTYSIMVGCIGGGIAEVVTPVVLRYFKKK